MTLNLILVCCCIAFWAVCLPKSMARSSNVRTTSVCCDRMAKCIALISMVACSGSVVTPSTPSLPVNVGGKAFESGRRGNFSFASPV